MIATVPDQVIPMLDQMIHHYHRLVIIAAPAGSGKTRSLHAIAAQRSDACYINLSLALSQLLLPLNEKQRLVDVPRLVDEIVEQAPQPIILFDHIELLFEPSLKRNALALLQDISRNRTIVVSWNGTVGQHALLYAQPGHPDYQEYPRKSLLIIQPGIQS